MTDGIRTKTAFLVIHGVGPHSSFQTCDVFARGFVDAFKKQRKKDVELRHLLKKREDLVQSCISLTEKSGKGCIDFYEYYWDIHMVHKVLPKEAWDLLVKASKNAKKHYDGIFEESKERVAKVVDMDKLLQSPFFRKRRKEKDKVEFRPEGYLRLIGGVTICIVKIIPYIPWVITALEWLSKTNILIVSQVYGVLSTAFKALSGLFQNQLEKHFAGDLVRYLDLDPRSKHYDTRQKIINGVVDELCALMEDEYERVILVGHSLGSVIAYDAINRLIVRMNAEDIQGDKARKTKDLSKKLVGLVTLGSPLDKIAFFFREYVSEEKKMQRKILANRHTFRTCSLLRPEDGIDDPESFNQLPDVVWLNFWHIKDYISGRLDLYDLTKVPPKNVGTVKEDGTRDGNICILEEETSFMKAHSCYWGAPKEEDSEPKRENNSGKKKDKDKVVTKMQEDIIKEFF